MGYFYMDGELVTKDETHNYRATSLPIDGSGCFLAGIDHDNGICTFLNPPKSRGALNASMTELRFSHPNTHFFSR